MTARRTSISALYERSSILELIAYLEYVFLRVLTRFLLGKGKRDELLRRGSINIDFFMCKHFLYMHTGFIKLLNKKEGFTVRNGFRYIVPFDASAAPKEVKRVYMKPNGGDVVIDAGAHYGFYTLHASRIVGNEGTVLAFEPHPHNYRRLLVNLHLNKIKNVKTFNIALGNFDGQTKLYIGGSSTHSTFFRAKKHLNVKIGKIDTIVDKLGLEKVDLIKIDTEGDELAVLKGAIKTIKKYKPKITIAAYHFPNEISKIREWLKVNNSSYIIKTIDNRFLHAFQKRIPSMSMQLSYPPNYSKMVHKSMGMTKPKYSILITNYNTMGVIEASLKSVLSQIEGDERFEVIVVDNNSTDGSQEVLRKFAREGKIKLFSIPSSRGKGRQVAFENSSGEVLITNIDMDIIYKRGLKEALELYHQLEKEYPKFMLGAGGCSIISRRLIEEVGGWHDLRRGEDTELSWRLNSVGCVFIGTETSLIKEHFPMQVRWNIIHNFFNTYVLFRDKLRVGVKAHQLIRFAWNEKRGSLWRRTLPGALLRILLLGFVVCLAKMTYRLKPCYFENKLSTYPPTLKTIKIPQKL